MRSFLYVSLVLMAGCGARSDLGLGESVTSSGETSAGGSGGEGGTSTGGGGAEVLACGYARRFGDVDAQTVTSLSMSQGGDVFLTGVFYGSIDLEDPPLDSGVHDVERVFVGGSMFVAKFDPSGRTSWSRWFGEPEDRTAHVAAHASGDIIVTTTSSLPLDLGLGTLDATGVVTAYVARIDGAGETVWSKPLFEADAFAFQFVDTLRVDARGDSYLYGVGSDDAHRYLFVTKIDAQGNERWRRVVQVDDGTLYSAGDQALVVDDVGASTFFFGVGSAFDIDVDVGLGPLPVDAGANQGVVVHLDPNGELVWARLVDERGGVGNTWANIGPIAVGDDGTIYFTFPFTGEVDVGAGSMRAPGGNAFAVTALDPEGRTLRSRAFGDGVAAASLTIDGDGSLLLGGTIEGSVLLGDEILENGDADADVFVARLAPTFEPLGGARYGSGSAHIASSVSASSGRVVVAGNLLGELTFCDETLEGEGLTDAFIAEIAAP